MLILIYFLWSCIYIYLLQLIYDVLAVSEATDFSPAASTVAKYRALRCHMTKLDLSASKYQVIQNILKDSEQRWFLLSCY